jgi:hypothetical protein
MAHSVHAPFRFLSIAAGPCAFADPAICHIGEGDLSVKSIVREM